MRTVEIQQDIEMVDPTVPLRSRIFLDVAPLEPLSRKERMWARLRGGF